MDAATFFGLEDTGRPNEWRLPVTARVSSGIGALFGGCGLGAAIEALERDTERPIVWATAQFLSYARTPDIVEISTTEVVRGRGVSQARAVGHVAGQEIFTVNAALGRRDVPWSGSWAEMPGVAPPDDCPPRPTLPHMQGTLADHLEVRLADARRADELPGPPGDGRSALWVRVPEVDTSAATLAVVGDFVPAGISQALGQRAGGNSLDNTLRVEHRHPTEWVLADTRVHAVVDGFGHGLVHLWSADGVLLGTASQSTMVRAWQERPGEGGSGR